jgi:ABC-type transport system involved in Fe-S cluster assembly fused permease/ATPase subunit
MQHEPANPKNAFVTLPWQIVIAIAPLLGFAIGLFLMRPGIRLPLLVLCVATIVIACISRRSGVAILAIAIAAITTPVGFHISLVIGFQKYGGDWMPQFIPIIAALLFLLLIVPAMVVRFFVRRTRPTNNALCPNCDYDLSGAAHINCPECGTPRTK